MRSSKRNEQVYNVDFSSGQRLEEAELRLQLNQPVDCARSKEIADAAAGGELGRTLEGQ